jgi:hypothetical protein
MNIEDGKVAKSYKVEAPWTPEQVAQLNAYQVSGWHPFTCGAVEYCGAGVLSNGLFAPYTTLVATEAGWVCPECDYTQDWAYEKMFRDWTPLVADSEVWEQ